MKFFWEEAPMTPVEIVDRIIGSRKSIRAFQPTPLAEGALDEILEVAARAPSGGNMQPWHVHVLEGAALRRFVEAACHAYDFQPEERRTEYEYYPSEFFEPYAARRRKVGWDCTTCSASSAAIKERCGSNKEEISSSLARLPG